MTGYYSVYLDIGDHHWDIELTPTAGLVTDDLLVLDGLRIGWSMPSGLFPQQPDPAYASLALNVPAAGDIYDIVEGTPVAIEVTLIPESSRKFSFYGRVTDCRAVPRVDREGVTLSVVAIDYTTDLGGVEQWQYTGAPGGPYGAVTYLDALWVDRPVMGDFPPVPGAPEGFTTFDVAEPTTLAPVRDHIDRELLQWVNWTGTDRRLILSPNIDPGTRLLDADQPWAFDLVGDLGYDPFIVESCYVETGSLTWIHQKGNGPTRVEVVGTVSIEADEHTGLDRQVTERIETTLLDSLDAQRVVDFYLLPDTLSRYQIDTFRYLISEVDDLDEFFPRLFPQLTGTPAAGDLERGACYGHPVHITDIPGHRVPLVGSTGHDVTVGGVLAGAELNIAGRRVSLDMQLRQIEVP